MAKLGSFYSLCPLIDNKNLLDVSEDLEEGVVIVTLGKNIASRYKLSDQKQITCWRTKEKFSSPVLYHKHKCKYVAVFNQSHVKFWDEENNLDKLKKYKFAKPIHTLLRVNDNYFILFKNGSLHKLDEAIEDRKTLLPSGADIKQIDHVLCTEVNSNVYIGLINEDIFYWTKHKEGACNYSKIKLYRNDLAIRGYAFHSMMNVAYLLTLWSDGSIFARSLEDSDLTKNNIGELFTVIDSVSPKHFVSITSLDENYIALYGANNNEEGAMLALYNIQFKVTQSQQPFKLFCTTSKIWKQGNTVLLPVGQNLAVVPFHLETEQLAALVGSHRKLQNALDPDIKIIQELDITSWNGKTFKQSIPDDLKEKMELFVKQGLSERTILDELMPDIFKQQDTKLLLLIFEHFSDIQEKYLVSVLNYALENSNTRLINTVLCRSFSEVLILSHLRSDLTTDNLLSLLKHILILWDENRTLKGLNYSETYTKFLEWICVLIDSNYQKIVLSNDEMFLETLSKINQLVKNNAESLEDLKALEPLLINFKTNKIENRCLNVASLRYSIEQISLY